MNSVNFNAQKSPSSLDERQDTSARDKIDEERNITAVSNELPVAQLVIGTPPCKEGVCDDRPAAVSNLLRYGVVLASLIVFVGGVRYFISHGAETADFQFFRGEPSELCSPVGVIKAVYSGNPLSLIQFGLLLLIATPVARVAFSLLTFIWQRDLIYALLTLFVLIGLIYGFIGAYV